MVDNSGRKTEQEHWDRAWRSPVRPRIPSRLNVDVRSLTDLVQGYVKPNARYIEIGCAPGKYLAWVAVKCRAQTSGLDYSETGIENCRQLFKAMKLDVDLHHGDFFDNDLPKSYFDVVSSFGFIEHFDDPTNAVRKHIELLVSGGVALITIPNYGGFLGKLQAKCDPENLSLHNTSIMSIEALTALVNTSLGCDVRAYPYGRPSMWLVNLERVMPNWLARAIKYSSNFIGHCLPNPIGSLAPMLVLEIRKR